MTQKEKYDPKKTKKITRNKKISLNINIIEYNYITAMSELEGISKSEYIRKRMMLPKYGRID